MKADHLTLLDQIIKTIRSDPPPELPKLIFVTTDKALADHAREHFGDSVTVIEYDELFSWSTSNEGT